VWPGKARGGRPSEVRPVRSPPPRRARSVVRGPRPRSRGPRRGTGARPSIRGVEDETSSDLTVMIKRHSAEDRGPLGNETSHAVRAMTHAAR
jgi:hypothetical protein